MRTLKLVVAYDGTNYHGFQRQNNAVGVQNLLEGMLTQVCGEKIVLAGSGRTDAGVHARHQVVSFSTNGRIPCPNIVRVARSLLPEDIVVRSAEEVPEDFNARKSACFKRYEYQILNTEEPNPFLRQYSWWLNKPLDLDLLQQAAKVVLGTHDFSAYRSAGSAPVSPIKTIYASSWQYNPQGLLTYQITGNGFVYHMVRNLVWAMVQVGLGKVSLQAFREELKRAERNALNEPAPAQGLYLDYVGYEPWEQGK